MQIARVVEIHLRKSGAYGSGYLVAPSVILTAGHVVAPEGWERGMSPSELYRVRPVCDLISQRPPWAEATLVWWSRDHDIAILHTDAPNIPTTGLPPLGRIFPGDQPVVCRAIGFPTATEHDAVNDTHDVGGEIRPGGAVVSGTLWVDVKTAPPADPSQWAGISGAALF
jgi:Trypsin-like peptidase domain